MILSNLKLQSLCTLSITKFCQNFILILPKWRISISIALDLQQALITTKLNVELGKRPLAFSGLRVWREIPSDVKSFSPGGFKTKYTSS